ncbi:MFS transporter [Mariniluteicoccus endophyticus]
MSRPTLEARRARWAVATLFWLNGATMASLVPRYPQIRDNLEMSNSLLGLAIAAGPLGGLVGGMFTTWAMKRWGSGRVATWAQVMQILAFCLVLNAPHPALFAACIVLMSTTDVYTDVAMNVHGLRVQKLYGRSINNSFHAFWSLGAVCGGLLGATFAGMNLALPLHAAISAAIFLTINLTLRRFLLKGPDTPDALEGDEGPPTKIPRGMLVPLVALGLVAAFGASIEDAGFTWSALYLRDSLHAAPAIAGLGVVCVVGAQTIGRFTGDRLVDALGDRGAARLGCGVATLGMGLALLFPSIPMTMVGFACAGWGVATIVPGVYYTAHHLPGLPPGAGLAVVNWLLRAAFFIGPPLVGRLSDVVSFRVALIVMPAATLGVLVLSGFLAGRRTDAEPA